MKRVHRQSGSNIQYSKSRKNTQPKNEVMIFDTIDKLIDYVTITKNSKEEYSSYTNTMNSLLTISINDFTNQLDDLFRECFPMYFPLGGSFIENIRNMVKLGKIKSDKVATLILIQKNYTTPSRTPSTTPSTTRSGFTIIGCVQVIKGGNDDEYLSNTTCKIINLCRKRGKIYKGTGSYILECALKYIRTLSDYVCVKLSVRANNTNLQSYYQELGWKHTYNYDETNEYEPAFEMIYFL